MAVIAGACALLAATVALLCSLGLFAMRDAVDRLHYLGPVTTIAPALLAIGIVVEDGFTSQAGIKALVVAVLAITTSPFVQFVILRSIVTRRHGSPDAPVAPELQT